MSVLSRIEEILNSSPVVLFMKGNKQFPQCGFSGKVVHILNSIGVEYTVFDVLEDDEIRDGIKTYANWPTIPQLYVQNQFVGGCDIIMDMHESGDLIKLLKQAEIITS